MCRFKSAIVTRPVGNSPMKILHHEMTDSHSDLMVHFGLKESRNAHNFIRVEFTPNGNAYDNPDQYELTVDETRTPKWFDAEASETVSKCLRGVIKSMIVTDERQLLLGGAWIIGKGAKIDTARESRIQAMCGGTLTAMCGGTLTEMCGGTLTEMCGGTLTAMRGGTLTAMWGGTLTAMRGGTLTAMRGGTLTEMWGGTLTAMRGGTLTAMWGGTLTAMRGGTLIRVGTYANLSDQVKAARAAKEAATV